MSDHSEFLDGWRSTMARTPTGHRVHCLSPAALITVGNMNGAAYTDEDGEAACRLRINIRDMQLPRSSPSGVLQEAAVSNGTSPSRDRCCVCTSTDIEQRRHRRQSNEHARHRTTAASRTTSTTGGSRCRSTLFNNGHDRYFDGLGVRRGRASGRSAACSPRGQDPRSSTASASHATPRTVNPRRGLYGAHRLKTSPRPPTTTGRPHGMPRSFHMQGPADALQWSASVHNGLDRTVAVTAIGSTPRP